VNNAGVSVLGRDHRRGHVRGRVAPHVAVNLDAHARLVRALPYLQASGAGRIVNIASTEE
jgi:NAD(P)-dependent dehydrogenase (short-subunit alcohol dehydrogenase family)